MSQQYPQYFELEKIPVRIDSGRSVPEIYHGGGVWKPYPDSFDVRTNGRMIDADAFNRLISSFDAALKH